MSRIKSPRSIQSQSIIKTLLTLCLFLSLTISFSIDIRPTIQVKDGSFNYKMSCKDFTGKVTYKVDGLPNGIQLYEDTLVVARNGVKSGYYPIKITAWDLNGNRDQRIIVLIVSSDVANGSASILNLTGSAASSIISQSSQSSIISQSSQSSQSSQTSRSQQLLSVSGSSQTLQTSQKSQTASNSQKLTNANSNNQNIPVPQSPSDINSILQRYGSQVIINDRTTTVIVAKQQNGNTFPTADFPNEKDPKAAPNVQKLSIVTGNAKFSDADKNTITQNEIVKNVILERSISAQKSVANLLSIIEQSKANRNSALAQIEIYKAQYNTAIQNQRSVQSEIIQGENSVQKLNVAINGANTELKNLQNKLKLLEESRVDLMNKIQNNKVIIAQSQDSISKLNVQLLKRKQEVKNLQVKLSKSLTAKESTTKKLIETQEKMNDVKEKYNRAPNDRLNSKNTMDTLQNTIDDLQNKLVYARNQLASEKQKFNKLVVFQNGAKEVLANLNNQIVNYTTDIQQIGFVITQTAADIKSNIADVIPAIENQIKKLFDQIIGSEQEIKTLTKKVTDEAEVPAQIARQKYAQTQSDLSFLKAQVEIFNENLRKLYIKGNDANTKVRNAKENLDAIIAREQKERGITKEATLNLEKARAEKELADLAVEQIIASRTDALPYSIIPNGNGRTDAGTPTGNNPSGSPLGPVANNGGYNGPYIINDWTHYLSQAFGSGVHPAFSKSVNALYPFKISDNLRISNSNDEFPCKQPSIYSLESLESLDGTIISYDSNNIVAIDNKGYTNTIEVAPCTTVLANVQSYKPQIGDAIVWKGINDGKRIWKSQQVTCLRNK